MGHYKSNVRDLEFNLFEVFNRQDVLGHGIYADVDVDAAKDILREVSRLAENELAESLLDSDRNPPVYDPTSQTVTMPDSFKRSFKAYVDGDWGNLDVPAELGGMVVRRRCAGPSPRWSAAPTRPSTCSRPATPSPTSCGTWATTTRRSSPSTSSTRPGTRRWC